MTLPTEAVHIVHISTQQSWRGGEQQLAYLVEHLNQHGVRQHIVCRYGGSVHHYCKQHRYTHTTIPARSALSLTSCATIASVCKRIPNAIVHAHDARAHSYAVLAAQFMGLRSAIVVSRRVETPVASGFFSAAKYNHPSVKCIACVSEHVRSIMASSMRNTDKLITIHDGINQHRFSQIRLGTLRADLGLDNTVPLVGTVAALDPLKGLETFINTAAILHSADSTIRFVILGEGALRAELEALRSSLTLEPIVFLPGFRTNIHELLPDLDVFLFPSRSEGLGTSILDSMAAGVPVVATSVGGIPELVQHERNGLLVESHSPRDLADAVLQLLRNNTMRATIIHEAHHTVQRFDVSAMANRYLQVYRSIISSSN